MKKLMVAAAIAAMGSAAFAFNAETPVSVDAQVYNLTFTGKYVGNAMKKDEVLKDKAKVYSGTLKVLCVVDGENTYSVAYGTAKGKFTNAYKNEKKPANQSLFIGNEAETDFAVTRSFDDLNAAVSVKDAALKGLGSGKINKGEKFLKSAAGNFTADAFTVVEKDGKFVQVKDAFGTWKLARDTGVEKALKNAKKPLEPCLGAILAKKGVELVQK